MATDTTEVETLATSQTSFEDLGFAKEVLAAVRDAGYEHPTPIQAQAIPLVLKGRDVMGLAQTGTGKTAAFTLPIVNQLLGGPRRTRALVLTPTRELCVQVEESVQKYARHSDLNVVSVYGGVPIEPQQRKLRSGVDIVVATPGRLIDHLERQNVVFDDLEVLVLDEADRMLDMGFAPQINRIVSDIPPYRQTLLFSATMPSPPRDQSCMMIDLPPVPCSASFDASRAHESTVSHITSMSPRMKAASFAAGSSMTTNFTFTPYFCVNSEAGFDSMPPFATMPGA